MIKKNLLICFFLLILLSLFVNASSITYCEFEVLQDTKFENGFLETWLTNKQNIENRCSLNFGNKNPYWQLYEMSSYQHFCDNLPQDSSNSFPKILESEEFAWQYDPAWKISRNWDSDGGLWEEDDLWGTWVWYQKSPNSNIGTGWRVMHLHTPKQ